MVEPSGFGIVPWTKKVVEQFDVTTRKTLTATCNHHPHSAVDHIYLPQFAGGIGLMNVENLFIDGWPPYCHLF